MSSTVYPKKRLPISVSLGITTQLAETETVLDDLFASFPLEKQESFLFNTNSMAFICQDYDKKRSRQNELLVFLAIRRALALKNHTKLPVLIVVKKHQVGKQVAIELARYSTDYKLYNMIFAIKDKINKELLVKFHTQADFILLTYSQLRDAVFKKACPATEQIVLVNPLTKYSSHREVITLDDIIGGLYRHKCRKPHFTYLIDANSFPLLQEQDYQFLLNVEDCLFFGCKENAINRYNNKLNSSLQYLSDEHIQFFILRELYRGRKNLAGLVQQFKETITYKLHLFSNNIYPHYLEQKNDTFYEETIKRKTEVDKKIYRKLSKTLTLFKKKTSKTITGKELFEDSIQNKMKYSWEEPIETPPFLPLVEKKQDRNYYLTGLGKTLLIASSNHAGVKVGLSAFLQRMSNTLNKKIQPSAKYTIEEILNAYSMLIGDDPIDLPQTFKENLAGDAKLSEEELTNTFNSFIDREFGYILNTFTNHAAITLLSAFEELMDENALFFYNKLKNFKKKKKRSREENLPEAILKAVAYKPLMIGEASQKVKLEYNATSKELEKLAAKGFITSIKTMLNNGSVRLKYCQPEVLVQYPYLKKNCGICALYKKRFKNCPLLELLAIYDPTTFPTGYLEYICNAIEENATACENIVEYDDLEVKGEKVRYTITKNELEQKIRIIEGSFLLGQETQTKYSCVNCNTIIDEFGTGEDLFFPRKRVLCPNCATGYYRKNDQNILIQTEHRDVLRSKYYELTSSIPKILQETEPSYAYVIYDNEHADLVMIEDNSLVFEICNHRVPLEKVKYVYFAGCQHEELERFLKHLTNIRPERFAYTIKRSQQKKEEQVEITEGCESHSNEQYQKLHKLITFISEEEICNNSFLMARQLSNIGALLKHRKSIYEKNGSPTKINKQLYEMIDILMIVHTGVKSSYYGRQLEAQSQDCLFDLIKEEGGKVGLWTHGRVNSRLVKDLFLSTTIKVSNARAPLDAILNQLLRQFRFIVNKKFLKVGLDPFSMGPGLLHRRQTKSDIDQKGLYFDLVEPIGSLALITFLKALNDEVLSSADCTLELDGSGQEIYRVKSSSLEKIERLVEEALAEEVFYKGDNLPFLEAFEQNLLVFRQMIQLWFNQCIDDEMSPEVIIQCMNSAGFFPFVFCPAGLEEELDLIHNFTKKHASFFEGREEKVLAAREKRDCFRTKAKKKWLTSNGKRGEEKLQLSKHQMKEQERSLIIALLLMYLGLQMNVFFGYYTTNQIREMLQLSQNQVQRILTQIVAQGLLLKMKCKKECYYQLNFENKTVHEILFTLGHIPCHDSKRSNELVDNSNNVLSRISNLLLKVQWHKEGSPLTVGWIGWQIPSTILQVIEFVSEQVAFCSDNN